MVFEGAAVRVRVARFEERSQLPLAAACVTASAVRDVLSASFGASAVLHVLEPRIPSQSGWLAIANAALLYRVAGGATDAAIVLRPADALAMASAAFGEGRAPERCGRALSSIEAEVLERTAVAIARSLGPVCGAIDAHAFARIGSLDGFTTYFELALERPIEARIGIALAREPRNEGSPRLSAGDLEGVELPLAVTLDLGRMAAGELSALVPGCVVPITGSRAFRGSLLTGGRTLALGTCGARNGRYAFAIEEEQIR